MHPLRYAIAFAALAAVLALPLILTQAQPAPTASMPASAPATTSPASQPATATSPREGTWTFADETRAVVLKLQWKDQSFVLTIHPASPEANNRFARAGISGLGEGAAVRVVTGRFTVDGPRVAMTATSGLFEYAKDGAQMAWVLSAAGDRITNTKQLVLMRQTIATTNP